MPRLLSPAVVSRSLQAKLKPIPNSAQQWLLVAVAMVLATFIWIYGWKRVKEGDIVEIPVTLVTADAHDLACALGGPVAQYRCEFRAPDIRFDAAPSATNQLAPYKDTRGNLYLIAGLFEQEALRAKLQEEPPGSKPREQLQRFTAVCSLRLLQLVRNTHVRWVPSTPWALVDASWATVPVSCRVEQ